MGEIVGIESMCSKPRNREFIINSMFENVEQQILDLVLTKYQLNKIVDKYVLKIKSYDDNSYNRKLIRKEELIFIRKVLIFRNFQILLSDQIDYKQKIDSSIHPGGGEFIETDIESYLLLFDRILDSYRKEIT